MVIIFDYAQCFNCFVIMLTFVLFCVFLSLFGHYMFFDYAHYFVTICVIILSLLGHYIVITMSPFIICIVLALICHYIVIMMSFLYCFNLLVIIWPIYCQFSLICLSTCLYVVIMMVSSLCSYVGHYFVIIWSF